MYNAYEIRYTEILYKIRVYLAILSLILLLVPFFYRDIGSVNFLVRADYYLWVSFIIAITSIILELRKNLNAYVYSSVFILLIGLLLILVGRFISVSLVIIDNRGSFYIGGFLFNYQVLALSYSFMISGMILSIGEIIMHKFIGIYSFKKGITLNVLFNKVYNFLIRHAVILAFFLGFLIRFIPEVYWWPMLIGYDTVDYAAQFRDLVVNPALLSNYIVNVPPVLYLLLYPFSLIIDPVILFKFIPSILYGLIISLLTLYAKKVLNIRDWRLLAIPLIGSFSIILLRLSWDLMKQLLSSVFIILTLISIDGKIKGKYGLFFLAPILILLASFSSEFGATTGAIISFFIMINCILGFIKERSKKHLLVFFLYLILMLISGYSVLWYLGYRSFVSSNPVAGTISSVSMLFSQETNYNDMFNVYPYIVISFGFLLPFFFIGIEDNWHKAPTSIFTSMSLFFLSIIPWITTFDLFGIWDRVFMVFALVLIPISVSKIKLIKGWLLRILLIGLIITPGFYATMSPNLSNYNSLYVLRGLQAGLAPSPPGPAYNELINIGKIVSGLNLTNSPLIVPDYTYRFIHLEDRNLYNIIIVYSYPTEADLACLGYGLNKTSLYVVDLGFLQTENITISKTINNGYCNNINLNAIINVNLNIITIYNGTYYKLYLVNLTYVQNE